MRGVPSNRRRRRDRAPSRTPRSRFPVAAVFLAVLVGGCAGGGQLVPLDDPTAVARRASVGTTPARPHHVTLAWEYADERGAVEGDGVLRYNPPDSLRLDLFLSSGDASMAAALVPEEGLRVAGQVENVQLPPPPFLYASAGILRPGTGEPREAFRGPEGDTVLIYGSAAESALRVRTEAGRLVEVEERRDGRTVRRTRLTWPEDTAAAWPAEAEYRDHELGRRARWRLGETRVMNEPFSPEIYDLPTAP